METKHRSDQDFMKLMENLDENLEAMRVELVKDQPNIDKLREIWMKMVDPVR